jgi:hypothetical protein
MVLGIVTTSTATAQHVRFGAGYGWILPTGDFSSTSESGWQFMGSVEVTLPHTPLALRADGMYGGTEGKDGFGVGTFHVSIWTASLVCHIGSPVAPLRPYVLAGVGWDIAESPYEGAFTAGAGLSVGPKRWKAFAEARYVSAGNFGSTSTPLTFVAITGGLSFGF